MKKKVFIGVGLISLGLAAFWWYGLAPRWTQRIPPGWTWKSDYIGVMTYADPKTGKLPEKDLTSPYRRIASVISEADRPRAVVIEDAYAILDPVNPNRKTWEYIYHATLDPKTGTHLAPEFQGQYYVFPHRVEKKTYLLRASYLKGIPLSFQREEQVVGLKTYLFAYAGRAEYTETYAGTAEFPGIAVKPGEEIRCADDELVYRTWVEPVTGEALKIEESCLSGDAIYETATGKLLSFVARWSGITAGDDLLLRATLISKQRARYLWITRYVPALLLLVGLACFTAGVAVARPQQARSIPGEGINR